MIVLALALVLAAGGFDYMRGSNTHIPALMNGWGKALWTLLYGVCLGGIAGVAWQWLPAVAALWWAGSKGGWGYPIGYALTGQDPVFWDKGADGHASDGPEWYQRVLGIGHMPWLSLFVRGLWWGFPQVIIIAWQPRAGLITLAALVAFPGSVAVGRLLMPEEVLRDPETMILKRPFWTAAGMELIRGWMCGLAVLVAGLSL